MRILAISQYGWPEPHPALNVMEEMAKRGHHVLAVTGMPNYPMGDLYKGYEKNKVVKEHHSGIHIVHVPIVPRKHNPVHRLLNYHSYPVNAKKEILKLSDDFDVVFANQSSPVMMVEPAIAYAKKNHKKVVMYCMDLWPASLCVGGIKKNSALYKYYWKRSKRVYSNVDVILVTSRMFKDYFVEEFGIPRDKIVYLPQYAAAEYIDIPKADKKDTIDFVFAGNVGKAQNLGVVLRAAKIIQDEYSDNQRRILFHIVGDGQELDSLKAYAQENQINNVIFHGRKPLKDMPYYYALADAMLVSMLPDPVVSLTLPAKIQSYMAARKPIIACANGEICNVINDAECGFCAKADDELGLVNAVYKFLNDPNREQFEINSAKYYEQYFSVEKLMDQLEEILKESCNS